MSQPPFGFSPSSGGGGVNIIDGSGNALADNEVVRGSSATGIQGSDLLLEDISAGSVTLHTSAGTALVVEVTEPAAAAGASVAGDTLTINAGDAVASTDTAGAAAGGAVTITSGAAARLTSGDADGGAINITGGDGVGNGTAGNIFLDVIQAGGNNGTVHVRGAGWTQGGIRLNQSTVASGTSDANNPSINLNAAGTGTVIGITNGGQIKFSVSNNAENELSQGIAYGGVTGGLRITDGSTGMGYLKSTLLVVAEITDPETVAATDSGKVFQNIGASAPTTYTLPGAVAGLHYIFIVGAAQNMVVDAAAGDIIQIGGSASSSGGTATNGTIGSCLHIVAIDGTSWTAISSTGTWTLA